MIRVERKEWMKMSINHEINRLIHFAVQKNLMKEEDRYYVANRLLDVLKVAEFTPEDDIEETLPTATPVLKEMLDYATQWVGRIDYASSQNNTDDSGRRFEELHDGGATDCSWFVYHVLFRYGLVGDDFIHSYEWGNDPWCYPGAENIGSDMDDASPGDIICTGEGTKPQNSHVMIYLGDGEVVECAAGHGVQISGAPWSPRQIVHFNCIPTSETSKTVDTE